MECKVWFEENYPLTLLIVWVFFPVSIIVSLIYRPLQMLIFIPPLYTLFSPMLLLLFDLNEKVK